MFWRIFLRSCTSTLHGANVADEIDWHGKDSPPSLTVYTLTAAPPRSRLALASLQRRRTQALRAVPEGTALSQMTERAWFSKQFRDWLLTCWVPSMGCSASCKRLATADAVGDTPGSLLISKEVRSLFRGCCVERSCPLKVLACRS